MIFNQLKKREIPYNVVQAYHSVGKFLYTEKRIYSIIVLNQFANNLGELIKTKDNFYYSEYENIYCYEMDKEEVQEFMKLRLPVAFSNGDGTFFGEDLRKFKQKNNGKI